MSPRKEMRAGAALVGDFTVIVDRAKRDILRLCRGGEEVSETEEVEVGRNENQDPLPCAVGGSG